MDVCDTLTSGLKGTRATLLASRRVKWIVECLAERVVDVGGGSVCGRVEDWNTRARQDRYSRDTCYCLCGRAGGQAGRLAESPAAEEQEGCEQGWKRRGILGFGLVYESIAV